MPVRMKNGRRSMENSAQAVGRLNNFALRPPPLIGYVLDTDFGALTLVFSQTQTVSGLQIRTPSGEWKHVKSIPDGITVNVSIIHAISILATDILQVGDTLAMLTNGYLKSTVHAVQRPPPDQDQFDRLALLYFLRLGDNVEILPCPSPLLRRIGRIREQEKSPNEDPVRGEGKSPDLELSRAGYSWTYPL
jgi:isopenicillin N synthase-like dioxygenase